jgi:arsenate reductase
MTQKRVLILCTGNSCRSQMAEGLINHDLGDTWQAYSAGTDPSGSVHPLAVKVMAELGIDISDGVSESADAYQDRNLDVAITVCDDAFEKCPLWLGSGKVVHIGFEDPAHTTGSEETRMAVFRRVRDQIREEVLGYLRNDEFDNIP